MYVLKKAKRSSGAPMGAVIPLYHCYMPIQLIPRFGAKADCQLHHWSSTEHSQEFFLNHYFDTEDFFLLRNTF